MVVKQLDNVRISDTDKNLQRTKMCLRDKFGPDHLRETDFV